MMIDESYISSCVYQRPAAAAWRLPAIGFAAYGLVAIAAQLLEMQGLLIVGGTLLFLCVGIAWSRSTMAIRVDKTVELVLCILLLALCATLYDPTYTVFHNLTKHVVICVVYVFVFSMGLGPVYSRPFRSVFVLVLLVMGAISLLVPGAGEMDNEIRRMSGLFTNANNLSLTMMTLLFLIDEDKDSRAKKIFFHGVILLFLILAGTSGAILAYLGAMLFRSWVFLRLARAGHLTLIVGTGSVVLLILGCSLAARVWLHVPLARRIVTQLDLIGHELPLAASGYELDYGELSDMYDTSDCSGIWRISHWRAGVDILADANIFQLLCGHGVGSSGILLYKLPHNDYLRVLMEQGILGLTLSAAFFLIVFRRVDLRYRHVIVAMALFCFSENNMDNLLFMSLFAFFLASAQTSAVPRPVTATR